MDNWISQIGTDDDPNYYANSPETSLITSSRPSNFILGTGSQVLSSVLSSCLDTKHELIIVTCFWAKSKSQQDVAKLLRNLSEKALSNGSGTKIRVRLCFSSISIFQKLFQTSSLDGKNYPPSVWSQMGLPSPEQISGLELVVKSIFVRPFSVMHPKFIIVDRQRAFIPSCNVSWEDWFEGCIDTEGSIVEKLFEFWLAFWNRGQNLPPLPHIAPRQLGTHDSPAAVINSTTFSIGRDVKTMLLPSPHHQNPRFAPFGTSDIPPTPLNTYLLHVLSAAKSNSSVYIQTPNLTSRPFIKGIFLALQRGVNIEIVTSRRLMILEQLVTAGTITEFEIWKLRRQYAKFLPKADPEQGLLPLGTLKIGYFKPKNEDAGEPVKSHFKCVIVDEEITVLGSGNMDRASWYTSQELGVAFVSKEIARSIRECINKGLEERVDYIC